ncbi:MAG TPA: transcriptional repressor LexA [Zoogloea sp.]|uniref:transcriptional repressor LexA n=1 Tax=Zoogloea sp. TaxID=49181 RepID=UPI002CE51835|nr:transcriptional repressor LexA [Zoogloea sp.]HMV17021.1 transcriptional repressor LexA [Rhodocyclaceae bacterium]HMV62308.1 transcriptional repressor LexA [Rhodocyclaceae bacterium]HMW51993.1 transcriptional repressor LexA [Rhodocyclaceae bacterium]HMY49208.1 transcriptional repressor LexA [Rhodocyclaceae bacterium]HMZ75427.1 transcriptional repressor LexA [Rhodocyclaceae bacterium]
MSEKLTARQQEILQLIRDTVEHEGRPPTRAEICTAFGFRSPNAAETHLRALAAKGVISLEEGRARGIRLTEALGLPLVGRVAAGSPILAAEHVQGRFQVDPSLFSPRADYLLKVRGMSMRDAGILDGDLLAVHRTAEARNGQIVVARVDDEVTVKRLSRSGPIVELLPANPDFEPIVVDTRRDLLEIEGLAVGLIRSEPL